MDYAQTDKSSPEENIKNPHPAVEMSGDQERQKEIEHARSEDSPAKRATPYSLDELIRQHEYLSPTNQELQKALTGEQYRVTKQNATELPYANEYSDNFKKGIYVDITSGEPLFTSMEKFESGCGWPSFTHPITEEVLTEHEDRTFFTTRTEVRSRAGNVHLGHVFPDGPKQSGGLRYCINSAALKFIPYGELEQEGYAYLKTIFDQAEN